jgi:serine protease Do
MKSIKLTRYNFRTLGIITLGISSFINPSYAGLNAVEFEKKLQKDGTVIHNGQHLMMSYSSVAERILPSLVTINVFGKKKQRIQAQRRDGSDQLPEELEQFRRFFGLPPSDRDGDRTPGLKNPRDRRNQDDETNEEEPQGVGSGFIITSDGYILTNNHVIDKADKIEATIEVNGKLVKHIAKVVGTDPKTDVALIKIDALNLNCSTLGDSSTVKVGDVVLAAGAPMHLSRSVTQGIVSAKGRSNIGILSQNIPKGGSAGYEDFIQTDASINPGNSGGPLVDAQGRVIGINTAILSGSGMSAGIGFAIPINMAVKIAKDLLETGSVQRGYLGIGLRNLGDLTKVEKEQYNVIDDNGVIVDVVKGSSPASKAGLKIGDIIVGVDGEEVSEMTRVRNMISSKSPGSSIDLKIMRDGQKLTISPVLGKLSDDGTSGSEDTSTPAVGQTQGEKRVEMFGGAMIEPLNEENRRKFDIPEEIQGLIVVQVRSGLQADLLAGDVIMRVNKMNTTTLSEMKSQLNSSGKSVVADLYRSGDTMRITLQK